MQAICNNRCMLWDMSGCILFVVGVATISCLGVISRLHDNTRLHDDACLRLTCLRDVFARPRVFATTRALARPVFGKCLLGRSWLHFWTGLGKDSAPGRCLREDTCLCDDTSPDTCLRRECVFRRPRVFAVFAWHVSADAYVSSKTVR